jgi:hypothetical protein
LGQLFYSLAAIVEQLSQLLAEAEQTRFELNNPMSHFALNPMVTLMAGQASN